MSDAKDLYKKKYANRLQDEFDDGGRRKRKLEPVQVGGGGGDEGREASHSAALFLARASLRSRPLAVSISLWCDLFFFLRHLFALGSHLLIKKQEHGGSIWYVSAHT